MCLTAIDINLNEVVLASEASKKHRYICRDCKEDLTLKKGLVREHHFSHKHKSNCKFSGGGESKTHYNMKYAIKEIIETQLQPPVSIIEHEISPYIADYYFELEGNPRRKVAVECVWKHTQYDHYLEKKEYYEREGIYCIWLFNKKILYNHEGEQKEELRLSEIHEDVLNQTGFFHYKQSILAIDTEIPELLRIQLHLRKGCKRTYKYTAVPLTNFTTQFYRYKYIELLETIVTPQREDRENIVTCGKYLAELLTDYYQEQFSNDIIITCKQELASSKTNEVLFHAGYIHEYGRVKPVDHVIQSLCHQLKVGYDPRVDDDYVSIHLCYGDESYLNMKSPHVNNIGIQWKQLQKRKQFQYKTIQSHCKRMLQMIYNTYPHSVNKYDFTIENLKMNKLITILGDYQWLEDHEYITTKQNNITLTRKGLEELQMNRTKVNNELLYAAPQEYSIYFINEKQEEGVSEKYNNTLLLTSYEGTFIGEKTTEYNGNKKYFYEFQDLNGNIEKINKNMFTYLEHDLEVGEKYHMEKTPTYLEAYLITDDEVYQQIMGNATTTPENKQEQSRTIKSSPVQESSETSKPDTQLKQVETDLDWMEHKTDLYDRIIKQINNALIMDNMDFFSKEEIMKLTEIKGDIKLLTERVWI